MRRNSLVPECPPAAGQPRSESDSVEARLRRVRPPATWFDATKEERAAIIAAGETSAPRAQSLDELSEGNEGLDLPELDTVLMLRPTESRILWLHLQPSGRRPGGPRPAGARPGRADPFVCCDGVDFVDWEGEADHRPVAAPRSSPSHAVAGTRVEGLTPPASRSPVLPTPRAGPSSPAPCEVGRGIGRQLLQRSEVAELTPKLVPARRVAGVQAEPPVARREAPADGLTAWA